jgi:glycine cleavage system H lipoate-binding protein
VHPNRVRLVADELAGSPQLVNEEPYDGGWLAVIRAANWEADRARLLDPTAYLAVVKAQAEEELNQS